MKTNYEEIRERLMTNEHLHKLFEELEKEKPSLDGQIRTAPEGKNKPE